MATSHVHENSEGKSPVTLTILTCVKNVLDESGMAGYFSPLAGVARAAFHL